MGKVLRSGNDDWKAIGQYEAEGADIRRNRAIVPIEVTDVYALSSPVDSLGLEEDDVRRSWEEFHVKRRQKVVLGLVPPNDF
ncbi:MAG: hypothetical protein ACREDE_02495 [Thermoplasmata archaeon]